MKKKTLLSPIYCDGQNLLLPFFHGSGPEDINVDIRKREHLHDKRYNVTYSKATLRTQHSPPMSENEVPRSSFPRVTRLTKSEPRLS